MTPDQMTVLSTAFAAYLRIFESCVAYRPTAEHLHSYCRGLLSDLARKSIEPIALACGTAVRTLQEFLRDHVWDQFRMRDLLQQRLLRSPALNVADDLGTIGVIDERRSPRKEPRPRACIGNIVERAANSRTASSPCIWGLFVVSSKR